MNNLFLMTEVTIVFIRRSYNHDGYCSGSECESTCEVKTNQICVDLSAIPEDLQSSIKKEPLGSILSKDLMESIEPYLNLTKYADYNGGSGYCDDGEYKWTDMSKHEVTEDLISVVVTLK